jgi:hypothetical protein
MYIPGSGNHLVDGAQEEFDKKFICKCEKCQREVTDLQAKETDELIGHILCTFCYDKYSKCPNCSSMQLNEDINEEGCPECIP